MFSKELTSRGRIKLAEYLKSMNDGIDWESFLDENIGKEDRKTISKIKSLLWIDKDIKYTWDFTNIYFKHYMSLLNKFRTHNTVYYTNPDENCPEELLLNVLDRINI